MLRLRFCPLWLRRSSSDSGALFPVSALAVGLLLRNEKRNSNVILFAIGLDAAESMLKNYEDSQATAFQIGHHTWHSS